MEKQTMMWTDSINFCLGFKIRFFHEANNNNNNNNER